MIEDLIKKIKTTYSLNQCQDIIETINILKNIEFSSPIYDMAFAIGLANNIIDNKLDYKSVVVGLYYPILKNNALDKTNLLKIDDEIFSMIKALETIEKLNIYTKQEQLESIKHMFLGIAKDLRVMIIKLCIEQEKLNYLDKFSESELEHLMKGFGDIFAPISAMLGMSQIKNKLENATFKYYKPKLYEELSIALSEYVEERNDNIQEVIKKIKEEISPLVSKCSVYGRQKQLYSVAKKLQKKNMDVNAILDIYGRNNNLSTITENKSFNEVTLTHILDILAVRIIVSTVEECYAVLGKIFSIFKPFGNFKDYISNPKANGYQSLHTAIILDNGDPVEVQIRTLDMHNYAEYGLAAHWAYKESKKVSSTDVKINYIRSIMELYKDKSNDELLEILKTDVYVGKIFVQSPQGKVLEFPEGSTPIDFAYAIHSKIGDSCVGAKINGKMVPLSTMLNNGDIVEIITNVNSKGPSRDWVKICKTSSAKSRIRAFFKREMKEENIKKGKSMLETHAKLKSINLSKLMVDEYLEELFERYSFSNIDDMYSSIGYGGISCTQVLNKLNTLYRENKPEEVPMQIVPQTTPKYKKYDGKVSVRGYSNLFTKFAKCCNPIPGDQIIGYVSRGNGVTIHRLDCATIKHYEFDRLIECEWNNSEDSSFIGAISVISAQGGNVFSTLSKKINDNKITIAGMSSRNLPDNKVQTILQLYINSKTQLDDIIIKIKSFPFVYDVYRNV